MTYDTMTGGVQGAPQAQAAPPIPPLPQTAGAATGQAQSGATGTGTLTPDQARQQVQQAAENLRTALEAQIAGRAAAGQAGTTQPPFSPGRDRNDIPREVIPIVGIVMSMVAAMVIGTPIARAVARMLDRRSESTTVKAGDVVPQIRRLQESVDAMAIELERISEAQRFTAKLMAEKVPALAGVESKRS
jgi:hypothetical protein